MSERVRPVDIRPGDRIQWCGREVEVLSVRPGKYRFRGGRPVGRDAYLTFAPSPEIAEGEFHWRFDEFVTRAAPTKEKPS